MRGPERRQGAGDQRGHRGREGAHPQPPATQPAQRVQLAAGRGEPVEDGLDVGRSRRPSSVSATPRGNRSKSTTPNSASSAAICRDTADWV